MRALVEIVVVLLPFAVLVAMAVSVLAALLRAMAPGLPTIHSPAGKTLGERTTDEAVGTDIASMAPRRSTSALHARHSGQIARQRRKVADSAQVPMHPTHGSMGLPK